MVNLREKMEELKRSMNAISKDFVYDNDLDSSTYICDAISEHSDSNVDIYYSDILDWARDNISEVNRGIEELGTSNDVFKDIQASQYIVNNEQLYEDLDDIILCLICEHLISLDVEELDEEKWDELEGESFGHHERFNDVLDWLYKDILEEINDEESTFEVDE